MWLSQETVQQLVESAEQADLVQLDFGTPPANAAGTARVEGYIPCVACSQLMQRRFDHRELERLLEYVRAGGLRRARAREIERQEQRLRRLREEQPALRGLDAEFPGPVSRPPPDLIDLLGGAGRVLGELLRRR